MSSILNWNLDPNLRWFVRIFASTSFLFLSEEDAVAGTGYVCYANIGSVDGKVVFPETEFTYLGKTYEIEYYDNTVDYHMVVDNSDGETNIIRVGPFFEIEAEEHPLYKNESIAESRALMLINERTHIQKLYTFGVPGFIVYEAFNSVDLTSSRVQPNNFKGKIESISYTLSRNSVVALLGVTKYERMKR